MDQSAASLQQYSRKHVYRTLDGMRFVAAMVVVTVHVQLFSSFQLPKRFLAVDLFFILSGFVIANAYESRILSGMKPLEFMTRRLVRLYPLYIFGIILGLMATIIEVGGFSPPMVYHLIASFLFIPNPDGWGDLFPLDGPMWSLFFEVLVNIVYVLGIFKLKGRLLFFVVACSGLTLVAFAILLHGVNFGWKLKTLPGGISRVMFSFYVGVILFRFHVRPAADRLFVVNSNFACWSLLVVVAALLCLPIPANFSQVFELFAIFCLFPCLVLLGIHCEPSGRSVKFFLTGGILSYAVYIIHEPLGRLLNPLFRYENPSNDPVSLLFLGILFVSVLLAFSFAASFYYDVPVRLAWERWLKRKFRAPYTEDVPFPGPTMIVVDAGREA